MKYNFRVMITDYRRDAISYIYNHRNSRLIYMIVILAVFFIKFSTDLQHFNTHEQRPPLFANLPDPHQPFAGGIIPVKVGLFVKNMTEFNIRQNSFEIEGSLWFEFNPNIVSLDNISHFQFENGSILERSEPYTKFIDQHVFVTYDIRVRFISRLVQKLFPLNDHQIYLFLKNDRLSPYEVHYEVDQKNIQLADTVRPMGWMPKGYRVRTGYTNNTLDKEDSKKILSFPGIIFSFDFAKPGLRYVLALLGPIFILFYLGLFGLMIHRDPSLQFSIIIGALSGLLIYRFVAENIIPNVGYFTLIDYLYLIFLSSTFIILISAVYELEKPLSQTFKSSMFYGLQTFALGILFILI